MAKPPIIHPGEILRHNFLDEYDMTMSQLAREIRVPVNRITSIVNGERSISADTAIRLGTFFGVTPRFWLNLQADYDVRVEMNRNSSEYEKIRPLELGVA